MDLHKKPGKVSKAVLRECLRFINDKSILQRPKWRDIISGKGQGGPDFRVDEFTTLHDLLTFTFVRHPFERWEKNRYSTKLQGPLFMRILSIG